MEIVLNQQDVKQCIEEEKEAPSSEFLKNDKKCKAIIVQCVANTHLEFFQRKEAEVLLSLSNTSNSIRNLKFEKPNISHIWLNYYRIGLVHKNKFQNKHKILLLNRTYFRVKLKVTNAGSFYNEFPFVSTKANPGFTSSSKKKAHCGWHFILFVTNIFK
ncbi:hypothetical protein RI129_005521 [Pyrocoelia pectoralis]|uniref:Uncharacterized protein n=1 Tax=Pyrocoelia pectoralis TaxID=417401 RepID=A0AAN7ZKH4_9COLE